MLTSFKKKSDQNFFKDMFDSLRGEKYKWYFTGHDLGGILAISEVVNHFLLLKKNLKEIVVFETPGCQHLVPADIH